MASDPIHLLQDSVTLLKLGCDAAGNLTELERRTVRARVNVASELDLEPHTMRQAWRGSIDVDPGAPLDPEWPHWRVDHGGRVMDVVAIEEKLRVGSAVRDYYQLRVGVA